MLLVFGTENSAGVFIVRVCVCLYIIVGVFIFYIFRMIYIKNTVKKIHETPIGIDFYM